MTSGYLDQELSFRAAAAALQRKRDPHGRKLRNLVLARERHSKQQIAIRLGGDVQPKLRVTMGALYRAFPELQPARIEQLAREVSPVVADAMSRVERAEREVAQLRALREQDRREWSQRLARLENSSRINASAGASQTRD